jgi:DnaK suppressor protein
MKLKARLEAKRLELVTQVRGRVAVDDRRRATIDRIQGMSDRDEAAGMLNRVSSILANLERSLRALESDEYGACIRCDRAIPIKRLESIPWAPCCVRCQEQIEVAAAEGSDPDFDELQAT